MWRGILVFVLRASLSDEETGCGAIINVGEDES